MGLTKYGECRHLIEIFDGFETKAFCGVKIVTFVTNSHTDNPVQYADHWYKDTCEHCIGILGNRRRI